MAKLAWLGWLVLVVLILASAWAGWVFFNHKRQGLPAPPLKAYIPFLDKSSSSSSNYPSPRSRNPIEWIKDQIMKLRNQRTHQGAYEESGMAAGGARSDYASAGAPRGRGRGAGTEDDAWDTRVGNEDPYGSGQTGYYEEQELGLAPTPGYTNEPYGRQDYIGQNTSYAGVNESRNLTTADKGKHRENPFGDEHAAPSLRSVSPRPAELDTTGASHGHRRDNASLDSTHSSPTSVRKSHFSEADMR